MAEVDVSSYRDNTLQSPLDMSNKLLENQQKQQQVQENNIKLATERFGMINNAASGLLQDPDLGNKDVTSKLWDIGGRLTKGDAMSAQHFVQFMQQFPDGSTPQGRAQQAQAIKAVHAQTLDAWQKGQAYLGQTRAIPTGGGTQFYNERAFGGQVQPGTYVEHTLPPTTEQVNPDLSKSPIGNAGRPSFYPPDNQLTRPPGGPSLSAPPNTGNAPQAQAVPQARQVTQPAPSKIITSAAPGEATAKEKTGGGSGQMLAEERSRASNYRREIYPLEQAIPALERLGKTGTGPGTEQVNQIKSFLQSVGVPGIDVQKIKDYDEAHKYLTDWVTANGDHSTNDKLAAAFSSNASTKISNAAAVDVAKSALALRRMKQAQLEEFESSGLPESQYGKWSAKWNREQDPRVYGWDYMSDPQRKALLQGVTGPKRDLLIMQLHKAADAGFVDPQSLTPSKK